jgi:hypothetical protein
VIGPLFILSASAGTFVNFIYDVESRPLVVSEARPRDHKFHYPGLSLNFTVAVAVTSDLLNMPSEGDTWM